MDIPAPMLLTGGIGLFLFGMHTLTVALRALAGEGARAMMRRFTDRPAQGMATGAALTALVQSSSAVMIMVLGLVGAGVMTQSQALGVVLGANVGTTLTGWLVMTLGVKVSLGAFALPLLLGGAMAQILGRGRWAQAGGALAGFALVFLGIEWMKGGMGAFDGLLSDGTLPGATLPGRLALVGLGVVVTVVLQSSSAGVAAVIVLLAQGQIGFPQAAALVIGMTVGTTFTGVLASLGGTLAMRRTALAHLLVNLVQGLVALALLDLVLRVGPSLRLGDPALALVLFHTGFTLAGALAVLPLVPWLAQRVTLWLPERPSAIGVLLDTRFLSDPQAATDMALAAARHAAGDVLAHLGAALAPQGARADSDAELARMGADQEALMDYLARIPWAETAGAPLYGELMQAGDHLRRLTARAGQGARLTLALYDPMLQREARLLGAILRLDDPHRQQRLLARMHERLERRERRVRRRILGRHAAPARLFALTDALRWLRRVALHAERVVVHLWGI
jgi:phosphate:Na+ symporter